MQFTNRQVQRVRARPFAKQQYKRDAAISMQRFLIRRFAFQAGAATYSIYTRLVALLYSFGWCIHSERGRKYLLARFVIFESARARLYLIMTLRAAHQDKNISVTSCYCGCWTIARTLCIKS